MNLLSATNRPHLIKALQENQYDIAVVGGGITGAGIALDAASRGLKVALIEKDDFGAGTSSKSTKLIHGGLRYLKQFEIQLVREVGRERATVHKLAPHLVVPEKMLLPLVKGGTYGPWSTSLGLKVYDFLAGVKGNDKRKMLSKKKTLLKEPLVSPDGLVGSGYYAEYRTDDARLTIENIKTSAAYGAHPINYVKAASFRYQDGQVRGINCIDTLSQEKFLVQSKFVISAAGPWVDTLRKADKSLEGKHLFLSKGVHIVVPFDKLPLNQSIYFDNNDGRMIFAIPRHRVTYIGTTDTPYEGDLNKIPIELEDVNYLLDATNQMFPDIQLKVEDVESSWAGLRPLIYEEGKSGAEMSRKDEIFESASGLVSIAGGKLTGYRKMAERVVNVITKKYSKTGLTQHIKPSFTQNIPLAGGHLKHTKDVTLYKKSLIEKVATLGLDSYYALYLLANYGAQTDHIIHQLNKDGDRPEIALIKAELAYTIENEMVNTALDFYNRRTGRLYFNLPSINATKDIILKEMQKRLGWDDSRLQEEQEALSAAVHHVSDFSTHSKKINV